MYVWWWHARITGGVAARACVRFVRAGRARKETTRTRTRTPLYAYAHANVSVLRAQRPAARDTPTKVPPCLARALAALLARLGRLALLAPSSPSSPNAPPFNAPPTSHTRCDGISESVPRKTH